MSKTLAEDFTIQDAFEPVGYDQWRELVEQALQGAPFEKKLVTHTYEGIDVQPIYCRQNARNDNDSIGFPGLAPFVRGSKPLGCIASGWDLRQEHTHPELTETNQAILGDLKGGATSILLRLDAAARDGFDPDQGGAEQLVGRDGVMVYCVDDLDAALANVDLTAVAIALDSGAAFLPAAMTLVGLWQRRSVSSSNAKGAFNADPIAAIAREGQLPQSSEASLESLAALANWTAHNYPGVTSVGVDTSAYHDAGATAAQDIAFGMATAVEYLRAMTGAELDVDTAAGQMLFRIGLGTHHFLAIAKLRAARRLWSRVVEASGGTPAAGVMRIHARTSNRVLTQRDPYVNLLRNTVAAFAAGIGGAEVITSVPFDAMAGLPNDFSRRVARNTVLVLQDEAHLSRVVDPAGGSWFLDQLTEQLADKAWETFQEVERQGGMLKALQCGWIANQIDAAYAPRAKDIARRKEGITGVSEFPDINEQRVAQPAPDPATLRTSATNRITTARPAETTVAEVTKVWDNQESQVACDSMVDAAVAGATIGQLSRAIGFHEAPSESIKPLEPRSFAEPFEELRDASDAWQVKHGRRPRIFLANMGPVAHHTARATYAKNFFEAGGFEVIGNNGFSDADSAASALAESEANIAVICSSDKLYPDFVPEVTPKLKQAGARTVILAGAPGENASTWQDAGVDRFIFMKCDVLETLRELLQEEGVLA